ncbi:unnamed protein product [Bursaphelenchus xylophilus]|uniref:(pine wood nematode) hypothetical protein n=1 Tax=Bursaphelenchus xylophilus TaxID=6326 RepID=A0A1I7SQM6_BURXY|nr:unnamed protein product [Bursaphelenchus xylophilus]CAG9110111.1 unnamed protein product [Bursaphelenchus xylophilus]
MAVNYSREPSRAYYKKLGVRFEPSATEALKSKEGRGNGNPEEFRGETRAPRDSGQVELRGSPQPACASRAPLGLSACGKKLLYGRE